MDNYDTSLMAKLLGQDWKTTVSGAFAAAGGILATQCTGRWQLVGSIMLALGLQSMGKTSAVSGVSTAQRDAAKADKTDTPSINPRQPPTALLLLIVALGASTMMIGCLAPVTVNVLSSRLIVAPGASNIVQSVEGGAILASNTTTATIPLK